LRPGKPPTAVAGRYQVVQRARLFWAAIPHVKAALQSLERPRDQVDERIGQLIGEALRVLKGPP
jgi:hypothetical protein